MTGRAFQPPPPTLRARAQAWLAGVIAAGFTAAADEQRSAAERFVVSATVTWPLLPLGLIAQALLLRALDGSADADEFMR